MSFCAEFFTCCLGIIMALGILGYIFYRWVFVRKGDTTVIRGPWGTRIETTETGDKGQFSEWTCSCGESVGRGETRCPRCGKRRDDSAIAVDYEDHPSDDSDEPDESEDGLIDLNVR